MARCLVTRKVRNGAKHLVAKFISLSVRRYVAIPFGTGNGPNKDSQYTYTSF